MRRHRRNDPDIIVLEEEAASGLTWLLAGAALGATLALLFSPGSGEENRQALGRQARRLRQTAEDAIDEAQDRFDSLRSGWLGDEEEAEEEDEDADEEADEDILDSGEADDAEEEAEEDEDEDEEEEEEEGEEEEAPRRRRGRAGRSESVSSARRELERRLARARARRAEPLAEEEEPVA